jgi:MFS family permease
MVTKTTLAKPKTSYVFLIACVAALGGFLFGFDTAVINGAVGALQTTFNSTSAMTGFAVSSALLGSALGAFIAGPIADRQGRIKTMIVASILFTLSAIGSVFLLASGISCSGVPWVELQLGWLVLLHLPILQRWLPLTYGEDSVLSNKWRL